MITEHDFYDLMEEHYAVFVETEVYSFVGEPRTKGWESHNPEHICVSVSGITSEDVLATVNFSVKELRTTDIRIVDDETIEVHENTGEKVQLKFLIPKEIGDESF